jgi:hypothetical protein
MDFKVSDDKKGSHWMQRSKLSKECDKFRVYHFSDGLNISLPVFDEAG